MGFNSTFVGLTLVPQSRPLPLPSKVSQFIVLELSQHSKLNSESVIASISKEYDCVTTKETTFSCGRGFQIGVSVIFYGIRFF